MNALLNHAGANFSSGAGQTQASRFTPHSPANKPFNTGPYISSPTSSSHARPFVQLQGAIQTRVASASEQVH
ncbi:MAG: hypothetical protein EAZ43_08720 [Betaproteobacteria bacterium]|nr:MAG: hypothetical protein EAZ43_08720 [Betaproteobacteria bacterium]